MASESIPPLRLEITEAAKALRISRAHLYKRIRAGEIAAQKDGKRAFVTIAELERYVKSLDVGSQRELRGAEIGGAADLSARPLAR